MDPVLAPDGDKDQTAMRVTGWQSVSRVLVRGRGHPTMGSGWSRVGRVRGWCWSLLVSVDVSARDPLLSGEWWRWRSLGYEKILVLTPLAGAFSRRVDVLIRSGQILADGTVWGSSLRLLVGFLQERLWAVCSHLYGQKQAGRVWYLHLKKNLLKLGFKPSQHDECVFYYGKTIFIVYTDKYNHAYFES